MTSYSAEDIRRAFAGHDRLNESEVLWALMKNNPVWTDSDAVTVKELRECLTRMFPDDRCGKCGTPFHGKDKPYLAVLKDILDHREPEHPYATVWKDDSGVCWFRSSDKHWMRFGYSERYPDDKPKRPLKRMDVV